MQSLILANQEIRVDSNEFVSLNDIWEVAKNRINVEGKANPSMWLEKPRSKKSGTSGRVSISGGPGWDIIVAISKEIRNKTEHDAADHKNNSQNRNKHMSDAAYHKNIPTLDMFEQADKGTIDLSNVLKITRGYKASTYAHWQVALAYASYLSPQLQLEIQDIYKRYKDADPVLAVDIIERQTNAKDAEWIAVRAEGKATRLGFTDTLKAHGVINQGYAACTNAHYIEILGGTKKQIAEQRNIPANTNLREHMSSDELVATMFAEMASRKKIEKENAQGNKACEAICFNTGRLVKGMM